MTHSTDQFDQVRHIFHELCELSPEARLQRLQALSDSDPDICAEVQSLLEFAGQDCPRIDEAPSKILRLIEDVAGNTPAPAPVNADATATLERIGPYTLHEVIGQGGMGVVHRATQGEPLHREVAVKLVRPGMATQAMLARFEAERRTLASMNHQNIAAIYDAGVTDDGRPYFVMQYVPGLPITDFCDEHQLSIEARIDLLATVCDAVQHAHRRGVIHRDLKPSNVLVQMVDGEPKAHIIDFGIAKALGGEVGDVANETMPGLLLGAPRYMSPEQATQDKAVDTRSDVYSLGVILYELLCGETPIHADSLSALRSSEVPELIRRFEPMAPSANLRAKSVAERAAIAEKRSCTARQLASNLRGELDWITLKAISRSRSERYESPADLAADLKRRRQREPVEAGPPDWRYRAGRFLSRYRWASLATAVIFLALLAGIAGVTWQGRQTRIEMRNSQQVNQFLHDVLSSNSPWRIGGASPTLRSVLDDASRDLASNTTLTKLTRARLHNTIGATYWGLSAYDEALVHFEESLPLFMETRGEAHSETIRVMSNLCHLLHRMGRFDEAEAYGRRALAIADRHLPPDSVVKGNVITNLGALIEDRGYDEEAEAMLLRAVEMRRRLDHPDDLTQSLSNLGSFLMSRNELDEARIHLEESVEIGVNELGEDHPVTLFAQMNYAVYMMRTNKLEEARALLEDVVERCRMVYGDRNFETISYSRKLILVYAGMGRLADSEALAGESLAISEEEFGPSHPMTMSLVEFYVAAIGMQGRIDEAFEIAMPWYENFRDTLGPDDPATSRMATLVAEIYDTIGDTENTDRWRAIAAGEIDDEAAAAEPDPS